MVIRDIQRVADLEENEQAFPEKGIAYGLRTIDNNHIDTDVEFIVRRENHLIARGFNGEDFPVSGKGAFVLTSRPTVALR